jgi:hypothetical protein
MANLALYARLPPPCLEHSDFICPLCREELWSCECEPLPTYEAVCEHPEIIERMEHGNCR